MSPVSVSVVLVRTLYDSNIGATSRAMANMGFSNLILIGRQCELTYKAQQAAATGQEAWQNRREYTTWDDFFANEAAGVRIAFSARDGRERPVWDWSLVLENLRTQDPRFSEDQTVATPVYLIFGPEDWGLSNEDLELAHFNANIPTYGDNSSLNLAQAVLLALFVLRSEWGGKRTLLDGQQPARGNRADVFPEQSLRTWLLEMGFDLSKPLNAYSVLKRLLLHNVPTPKELHMLETVLQQSIRKLREYNQLRRLK